MSQACVVIGFEAFLSRIGIMGYVVDKEGNERPVGGCVGGRLDAGIGRGPPVPEPSGGQCCDDRAHRTDLLGPGRERG
jgi:hypothetical protein